jgi:hypothetical protein
MSSALPETVDGRSLLFAVLITGVVAATAGTGLYRGPVEVLAVLPLIAVVWAGVYRPVARRIPYRDQLVGVAFLPIGVYRLTTDWPSILGGLFVLLAVVAIGQIARQEFQGARSRGA